MNNLSGPRYHCPSCTYATDYSNDMDEHIKVQHGQPDPSDQDRLNDFISDPETINKAVEGSMDKRNKVLDPSVPQEVFRIFPEYESLSPEKKRDVLQTLKSWTDAELQRFHTDPSGQDLRQQLQPYIRHLNNQEFALDELVALFEKHTAEAVREAERRGRIDELEQIVSTDRHRIVIYPNGKAITLDERLAALRQGGNES